ncbi:MAG TPA: hypothetical protein VFW87_01515 [Pirellulales bacterium]|nr:hypothetical protein [Pirellulales bacterium]
MTLARTLVGLTLVSFCVAASARAAEEEAVDVFNRGTKTSLAGASDAGWIKPVLAKDKMVEIMLRVRDQEFKAFAEGETIFSSSLTEPLPAPPEAWSIGEPLRIYFGSQESQLVVHGAWLAPMK